MTIKTPYDEVMQKADAALAGIIGALIGGADLDRIIDRAIIACEERATILSNYMPQSAEYWQDNVAALQARLRRGKSNAE